MKIYRGLNDQNLVFKPRAMAIGIFDGVHLGHQRILAQALKQAKRLGVGSMVVTFDPHPVKILHPKKNHPAILMSLAHRLRLLESLGISEALVVPFSKKFSAMTRESFLEDCLVQRLGLRALSVGHDFRFGYRALGDSRFLLAKAKEKSFFLSIAKPLKLAGEIISSTQVRHWIERGDLKKARRMLGRPVSVYGTVIRGRGRGRNLGFPTANLDPHHEALPPEGVYAALGFLDGRRLGGVIHIGERPTFKDRQKSLEVHFFNFHENIYGRELELIFVERLRRTRTFNHPQDLALAIQRDIQFSLQRISKHV